MSIATGFLLALILISSIDPTSWGQALRHFLTSPGAAIIAASIAATAIVLQLLHTRSQDKKQDWWTNFEWAAERAVPSKTDNKALPVALSINILNSLQDSADSELQKRACGGFVTLLAESLSESQNSSNVRTATPGSGPEIQKAVSDYVSATSNSPARSRGAESFLRAERYERQVIEALNQLQMRGIISETSHEGRATSYTDARYDALVRVGSIDMLIEVKYFDPQYPPATVSRRFREIRYRALQNSLGKPIIVISPIAAGLTDPQVTEAPVVRFIKWTVEDGLNVLSAALENVAAASSFRPKVAE